MPDHCSNCGHPNLQSQFRCKTCNEWVCKLCFVSSREICAPCTFTKRED
jgi:hypothetical protein